MQRSRTRAAVPALLVAALTLAALTFTASSASADATITLNGSSASASGSGADVSGSVVTITAPGTYRLSGTLSNGQIVVDQDGAGTVRLVLAGAGISSSTSAAINVVDAGDVVVELAAGTTNTLSDASGYVYPAGEDEPDAALFSSADLVITGTGALTVRGNQFDGIASKDGLVIESGTITVIAADDGIRGKDYLEVRGGTLNVTSNGGDGLKATNDGDPALGYTTISGGSVTVAAADDGVKGESSTNITAGSLVVTRSFEAIEGLKVNISGGTVDVTSTDDGINAAEEGLNEFAVSPNAAINVSGGTVVVNSTVDGFDSNGSMTFSGGVTVVNGPLQRIGEGALDANGPLTFNGGTVLAVGGSGSTSTPATNSAQGWLLATLPSAVAAGGVLHVATTTGTELVAFRASKQVRGLVYSSAQIRGGTSYAIHTGGTVSGTSTGGMYPPSTLAGSSQVATVAARGGTGVTTTTTTTTRPTTTTTTTRGDHDDHVDHDDAADHHHDPAEHDHHDDQRVERGLHRDLRGDRAVAGRVPGRGPGRRRVRGDQRLDGELDVRRRPGPDPGLGGDRDLLRVVGLGGQRRLERRAGSRSLDDLRLPGLLERQHNAVPALTCTAR